MPELGEALSGREIDVLKCVADGATNKEVASILSISPYTVKTHLRNIYTKLGASSRTEAIRVGQEKGFLSVPNQVINGHGVATIESVSQPIPANSLIQTTTSTPELSDSADTTKQRNWNMFGLISLAVVILIVGFVGLQNRGLLSSGPTLYEVEEMNNKWSVFQSPNEVKPDMVTAVVGFSLFQIGGLDVDSPSTDLVIINTGDQTVSSGTSKPTAVSDAAAAVLLGEIFVIGGIGETKSPEAIVEAYSPIDNAWRTITPLPTPISGALAVATQEALFVIGGHDGETAVSNLYKYDLTEDRWITLPEMPVARVSPAGDILNDQLIVTGGENDSGILTSCSLFDLDTEVWSDCRETINPRTKGEAVAYLGRLYLFGGQLSGDRTQHVAEIYNLEQDSWEPVEAPTEFDEWTNWEGVEVDTVGPDIYISGGTVNGIPSNNIYIFSPFPNRVYLPTTQTD